MFVKRISRFQEEFPCLIPRGIPEESQTCVIVRGCTAMWVHLDHLFACIQKYNYAGENR